MMHPHRRQALLLVLLMGVVALLAQVAGVGGTRTTKAPRAKARVIAVLPGATVPDLGSTRLETASVKAAAGDPLRMRATATVRATKLVARRSAQVVCGIRYARAGDASWTLGTPYETIQLTKRGAAKQVTIERSFAAPVADTYRMSVACHLSAPSTGATVTATGSMRAAVGLPEGAAQPVG